jgi:hypothetical protein
MNMKSVGILLSCIILVLVFAPKVAPKALACANTINTDVTVSSSCSFTGTTVGVDNGNITVGTGGTLSILNGQTMVRNTGKSITISGGGSIVLIGTARIVQSYIWCMDADSDGYCANQTYSYGDNSPGAGYRRLANMTDFTDDCSDSVVGPCIKRVFVMQPSTATGNQGGLSGADTKCQTRANTYLSNPGTFMAWLSSATVAASSRLNHFTGNYVLYDGTTVVANGWSDLTDGTLDTGINKDANGGTVGLMGVWTNTTINGSIYDSTATGGCSSWTSASSGASGRIGANGGTGSNWTNLQSSTCNSNSALICIEQ